MRKQTKLVAVLSTAALLAIGASMTSFAAQGWAEEDGTWVYYDKNGDKATESWKKSGDNWYWLDDNGEMATDLLVEDDDNYYYVDANGAMVRNQWVAIENEDAGEDDEPEHYWYYFQANGKAYKRSDSASTDVISAKVINGKKYAFDTEGKMLYGWVSDGERQTDDDAWKTCKYYFGDEDDGAMSVGWRLISITDDEAEDIQPGDEFWDEDQDRWFYFQSSGKKKAADENKGEVYTDKSINGKKYGFDQYGRMVASWYADLKTASLSESKTDKGTASQGTKKYTEEFMYFSSPEDGARYTKGWFKVVPGYYLHQAKYNDGDEYWYYADGDGNIVANEIKTIKGKKYAFDEYGRMINGLVFLQMTDGETASDIAQKLADDDDAHPYDTEDNFDDFVTFYHDEINKHEIRSYYFGSSDDGAMKTGKQTVDIDGDSFTFQFKKGSNLKGSGLIGVDDDKLYMAGKQVKADKDDKYTIYGYNEADNTVTEYSAAEFISKMVDDGKVEGGKAEILNDDGDQKWTFKDVNDSGVTYYVIGTSGTIVKTKSSAKDADDYKINVSKKVIKSITLEN